MRLLLAILLSFGCLGVSAMRVIHVIVALADDRHQNGVKVSQALGNGQDPNSNLLWGAGHGLRSHFNWAPEWERVDVRGPATAHILERLVWKHRDSAIYLIADAYDGRNIREATEDLLLYASGGGAGWVSTGGKVIPSGGGADLIVYIGHNGLMDVKVEKTFRPKGEHEREVMILASLSRGFFANPIRATGATPLLWTTGIIRPEAYILREALLAWVEDASAEDIRERAARSLDQYQRTGLAGARRLLVTGW